MDKNAFPSVIPDISRDYAECPGLSKREFFAALAMVGLLMDTPEGRCESVGWIAVRYADSLIKALDMPPGTGEAHNQEPQQ